MTNSIEIADIILQKDIVRIVGLSPLITARFGETAMEQIEAKQQKRAKDPGKRARKPEEEFYEALYVIHRDEKRYGIPALAIKQSLVGAGRFTDTPMTQLRGMFHVFPFEGELLEIDSPNPPEMRRDRVNLSRSTTSIAYRPQFWPWSISVPVEYNRDLISREQIVSLFRIAGTTQGIGAWRVEKNGIFGRYDVEAISPIDFKGEKE